MRQLRQQAGPDLTPSIVSALVTVAKGPITLGGLAMIGPMLPADRFPDPVRNAVGADGKPVFLHATQDGIQVIRLLQQ